MGGHVLFDLFEQLVLLRLNILCTSPVSVKTNILWQFAWSQSRFETATRSENYLSLFVFFKSRFHCCKFFQQFGCSILRTCRYQSCFEPHCNTEPYHVLSKRFLVIFHCWVCCCRCLTGDEAMQMSSHSARAKFHTAHALPHICRVVYCHILWRDAVATRPERAETFLVHTRRISDEQTKPSNWEKRPPASPLPQMETHLHLSATSLSVENGCTQFAETLNSCTMSCSAPYCPAQYSELVCKQESVWDSVSLILVVSFITSKIKLSCGF